MHVLCGRNDKDRDTYLCRCIDDKTPQVQEVNIEKKVQMTLVLTITQGTTIIENYRETPHDYIVTKE